jgi:hypothetical protein
MFTTVDIQMPVRHGGFIASDVLEKFPIQDVAFTFYVDATEDFSFTKAHGKMLKLTTTSRQHEYRMQISIKAAFKRNKMLLSGDSPYVYLADPDVLLPKRPVFGSMVDALERHPLLGAVGLCYQENQHVGAGSMMLRRRDLERIGELKGGASCVCSYISNRLRDEGLYTIPFQTVRATHLKPEYEDGYRKYETVKYRAVDRILDQNTINTLLQQSDGARFKLFIETPTKTTSRRVWHPHELGENVWEYR